MADTDPPIMCTLSPNSMVDRLTEFEALFAEHLAAVEREPLHLRLTFTVDAGQEAEARELFAAEQQCCAFLTFTYDRTDAGLAVSITAPEAAGPTLDGFQTLAERNARPATVARDWTG
ncbi:MAG: hypothetical protein ABIS86_03395 [Streptosporangiaceae bacterium]